MKNNYHLQSRMGEKRHYFGIRRLKVGVASVVIASGFLLGNARLVQADEASTTTSPATEAVSDANAAPQPKSADEEKTGEADSSGAGASEQAAPTGVLADQAPASADSQKETVRNSAFYLIHLKSHQIRCLSGAFRGCR